MPVFKFSLGGNLAGEYLHEVISWVKNINMCNWLKYVQSMQRVLNGAVVLQPTASVTTTIRPFIHNHSVKVQRKTENCT